MDNNELSMACTITEIVAETDRYKRFIAKSKDSDFSVLCYAKRSKTVDLNVIAEDNVVYIQGVYNLVPRRIGSGVTVYSNDFSVTNIY